jgi:dihydrofolate synthase / folylpolyglutamate synthase
MLKIIVPLADVIVTTKSCNPRACDPSQLKKMIEELKTKNEITVKDQINAAVDYAKSIVKKDDLICITGSLFTVGEVRNYLAKNL